MWAQGLTIGVMIGAGVLTHSQRIEAAQHVSPMRITPFFSHLLIASFLSVYLAKRRPLMGLHSQGARSGGARTEGAATAEAVASQSSSRAVIRIDVSLSSWDATHTHGRAHTSSLTNFMPYLTPCVPK